MAEKSGAHRVRGESLEKMADAELLDLQFRHLELPRYTGMVAIHMARLYRELRTRKISFRPHYWFAEEWFSPDGVPGIALPFYLAQPRLRRLERRFMHQVEGGNSHSLMRILRHEAGHALDTAYGLRHRDDWQEVFGRATERYPSDYTARPASKRFVLHLGHWYAQSHPTEDFAETFAVWLQPRTRWRREYADWPALHKLEFIDDLMRQIAGKPAQRRSHREIEPVERSAITLHEHYRRKAGRYKLEDYRYDLRLKRIFSSQPSRRHASAATFLRDVSPQIERLLARRAMLHPYIIEHALELLIHRCAEMHLRLRHDRRQAMRLFAGLVQRVVLEILRRNRENYAL
jgi:hypothetical protein